MSAIYEYIKDNKVNIKECLQQQLLDIETLQSIYMEPGEFEISDHGVHADVNEFVNSASIDVPNRLDFSLNLNLNGNKTEINFNLPNTFPYTRPSVYVVCSKLSRSELSCLNEDLDKFLTEITDNYCLFQIIEWIKESTQTYMNSKSNDIEINTVQQPKQESYCRFWVYSHHIYNKLKRKEILNLAQALNLTRFCLPGKPGIVCIEGELRNCEEWWSAIKSMNWQKINVIKRDTLDDYENERHFHDFEEKIFQKNVVKSTDKHMDMGEFFKFLEQHNCGHMFKYYFGFEGKCDK
ncbi:RWD domain-containing protein 2A-like [Ctenocephalides felis]|uniref:RWD domain-containing protein 2A-like n=1 Tax=Ctenocephalides felis TaxID=7515 RepID=UPI000E6E41E6|nr:RWD domain-containing protein 2A-like [Ctenocephalides felis]